MHELVTENEYSTEEVHVTLGTVHVFGVLIYMYNLVFTYVVCERLSVMHKQVSG